MEFFDGQVDHIRRRFPANTGFYAFMVGTIIDLSQGHSMLFQFGTHLFVYFEHIFPGIYPFSDSSLIGDDDQNPAAEMKHGPIALIDAEMPVVAIATTDSIYEKTISNIQEIKARKGKVIAIVSEGDQLVHDIADYCIEVPHVLEPFAPLVASIPLQLLAYYIAVNKGRNVDQPRNLAKSVTVE